MNAFRVRLAEDAEAWDAFVMRSSAPNEFLQSWRWGEFQRSAGKNISRVEVLDGDRRVAIALLVPHTTRLLKSFVLAPRGPLVDRSLSVDEQRAAWTALRDHLEKTRTVDTMFLKIEPNVRPPDGLGFIDGTAVHPDRTLLLDLTKSEEKLLKDMHQKTRYNIRLAERHGVTVGFSRTSEDFEAFGELLTETAQRQKIGIFPLSYYRQMVETLGESIEIALARLHTTPIAAALVVRFGDTATYLHGASSATHHEHMAPHLLQWESIRRAREAGARVYDFYGIAPEHADDHRWNGITRFKTGFGGRVHSYPGAFNLVYQKAWYFAYRLAKRAAGR